MGLNLNMATVLCSIHNKVLELTPESIAALRGIYRVGATQHRRYASD